ncbi:otoferlin-like isoform X2 [Convolutriloba macropyga]|uniref:otoferlin-like isoform X2 n=1 Tax=Convolutriloba macropyga TaxID=536237 RepID=UPI003F51D52B
MFQKLSKLSKKTSQNKTGTLPVSESSKRYELDEQQLEFFDDSLLQPISVSSKLPEDNETSAADSMFKESGFQINVHVIEAQRLAGAELHPYVIVEVADQKKITKVIEETVACPYFDESFVFDFVMPPVEMLNSIIKLTVLNKGGLFSKDENIGEFKIDVGTVYNQTGHCFFNRWAILFDPDDVANGTSGALKVTLGAIGKGDAIKPPADPEGDDEVIEGNELLPQGFPVERQLAHYRVRVYKAVGLPRMSSGIMGQFKLALGDVKDMVDPYVEITFSGLSAKTSVQQNDYTPEWYEEIVFSEMFPPMCTKLKLELRDKDSLTTSNIGTFVIDINEIACEQEAQGFMPTFGPTWVNLYGSLRSFSFSDQHDTLNRGVGEGVAFRGQLLVGLEVKLADPLRDIMTVAVLEEHNPLQPLNIMYSGKKEDFFLFCTIMEATMIEKTYAGKPIYFEISIGNYGNNIDGHNVHFKMEDVKKQEDSSDSNGPTSADEKKDSKEVGRTSSTSKGAGLGEEEDDDEEEITDSPYSDSKEFEPIQVDGQSDYYYLDIGSQKPCLFLRAQLRDLKERHFRQNILEHLISDLLEKLHNLSERLQGETVPTGTGESIKYLIGKFFSHATEYINQTFLQLNSTKIAGKTKLDSEKMIYAHRELDLVKSEFKRMKVPENSDSPQVYLEIIRNIRVNVNRMKKHLKEPQPGLPDVFLWMISGGKRVAYTRIPAAELLYSPTCEMERGKHCAKMRSIFLKLPGNLAKGQSGWAIQAKLELYLWLSHARNRKDAFEKIPTGYELTDKVEDPFKNYKPSKPWTIPRCISYQVEVKYMMRAHLYQARGLLPADVTGLSDPFARVIVANQCLETQILDETLNPTWDEMLLFPEITFNYGPAVLKQFKMPVIVEIFDADSMGSYEFIGRTRVSPVVKEGWQSYEKPDWPPDLEWHSVHRGTEQAGELLAQFELLEIPENENDREDKLPPSIEKEDRSTSSAVFPVPPEIRPVLCAYRLEVLFWGLRNLKRINLMKVDKPKVIIEVGNSSLVSEVILDIDRKPNFNVPVKFIAEIDLPQREVYMPPVTIRVMDCRKFGRETLVGTHSIHSLAPLLIQSERQRREAKEAKEEEANNDQMSAISAPSVLREAAIDPESQLGQTIIEMNNDQTITKLSAPASANRKLSNVFAFKRNLNNKRKLSQNPQLALLSPAVLTTEFAFSPTRGSPKLDHEKSLNASISAGTRNNQFLNVTPTRQSQITLEIEDSDRSHIDGGNSERDFKSEFGELEGDLGEPDDDDDDDDSEDEDEGIGDSDDVEIPLIKSYKDNKRAKNKKKQKGDPKDDDEIVLDWWTKYFASIQYFKEKQSDVPAEMKSTKGDKKKSNVSSGTGVVEGDDPDDDDEEAESDNEKGDSGKKKKKSKVKKEKVNKSKKKKKGDTVCFEVFDDELEKQPEFEGFVDLFESYRLRRGKKEYEDEEEDARVVGVFKGKVKIYKLPLDKEVEDSIDSRYGLFSYLPAMDPLPIVARIYVISAVNLHPMDTNGKADPYLQVALGKQAKNTKEDYVSKNLNPTFGKMFEFEFTLPLDSSVTVSVYDYDMVGSNDLIGETVVDLENRFYSRHRPICGLPQSFDLFGYNKWRDAEKPTQILTRLCRDLKIPEPIYKDNKVKVGGKIFRGKTSIVDEMGVTQVTNEPLALEALRRWHTVPKYGFHLVPEHIETRPLFNPETPGIEQGRLQMWVDLFPKDSHIPKPVDITPRIPKGYELRVIVWNTDDVILEEENLFGEKMSDIYVRGWLKGPNLDVQSTDVHYRSLTGEGNFNWRFVFPFDYLAAEEKIVFRQKESAFALDETEFKIPLRLQLQVWDADAFSSDDILGSLTIDLNRFPRGAKSTRRCGLDMLKTDGSVRQMSIFRNRRVKGWWPFTRKNDDQEFELTGKLEAEIHLLTADEAEKTPVGLGRSEPEPLFKPNRPDSTVMWFIQPLKSLALMLWRNHKWLIIKIVFITLLSAVLALFIYSAPGYMVKKVLGA